MNSAMDCFRYGKFKNEITECMTPYFDRSSSCTGINKVQLIAQAKRKEPHKEPVEKSTRLYQPVNSSSLWNIRAVTKCTSMVDIINTKATKQRILNSNGMPKNACCLSGSVYLLNVVSEPRCHDTVHPFYDANRIKCKVYRCEVSTNEAHYCPACNSQAMFEVIKSLYDCYMKRSCDNCNCILCGNFFREKRRLAQLKKAKSSVKVVSPSIKDIRDQIQNAETAMVGKTPSEKEKILKDLAMSGIPLPEGKTVSEKALINKLIKNLGLPPIPKTAAERVKVEKAAVLGLFKPLEGKSPTKKEKILRDLADMNILLPEGRTPSERALIQKVKASAPPDSLSEKLRKAKAAGLLTPLAAKTPAQKKKILRGLALTGLPLPEVKTPSEQKLINEVRSELGLPPEPKTKEMREKFAKAADLGLMQPLEGKPPHEKQKILTRLADMGIPLPKGRTPSEKALIAKIKAQTPAHSILAPSAKMRKAKAAGLITPLKSKTPKQREKILTGLASLGIPLPEGTTDSEKNIISKVRAKLGLPPEPNTPAMKDKHKKAADAGLLQPLEGKTEKGKERILRGLNDLGIPLPEGRTPSEKALITSIKAEPRAPSILAPSEKMRRAKATGLLTTLKDKTPDEKERILRGLANLGIALPEGTVSDKRLINKIREELGLPPEPKSQDMKDKHAKAADAGLMRPLEGKTPKEKAKILRGLKYLGIPMPTGRTPSEKALIAKIQAEPLTLTPAEKMQIAKAEGLLTPLKGKNPEQKENILKGLANLGIPLPEGKTDSEKEFINQFRANFGLPPEPKTPAMNDKHKKAADAGLLQPLEGKTPKEKENILRGLNTLGIPMPKGRTPSEKNLISKIMAEPLPPGEKMRRAKEAGLVTPLKGKTPEHKENILKGLANLGIPLPEGKTDSEKELINKVRANLGLPPEPKTPAMKDKHKKAGDAGLLQPLEGKTPKEKEDILRGLNDLGISMPEGRTPSEKNLISKIMAEPLPPGEKMRRAKEAGLVTPLKGKTPEHKENILKGLANLGIPLPEGKTDSEKELINKVRANLGLPPEPKTPAMKDKHKKAGDAGLLQPLEGKTPKEKEDILRGLNDLGISMPEGRTPSEKNLISKIMAEPLPPGEKMRRAKEAGLVTPLKGKTPEHKENILKGLANFGIPLPEGKTDSEKALVNKVRANLGLPPEPKTPAMKDKHKKAGDAGLLQPLDGKTPKEKEDILRGLNALGIPLPEGRTPSEKNLVSKIMAEPLPPEEKMRRAREAGLITPLKGKTPEQKENILKSLANLGIPLPEGKTDSEKELINKVQANLGLPPEPKTPAMKDKHAKAADAGLLLPLEGKTPKEKERILRGLNDLGIPLPTGRTHSEKALINNIQTESKIPSEKLRKAKGAGLITPLKGKTPKQKEKILKGLVNLGIPLPEGTTDSEKNLINKVRADLGLPPEPETSAMIDKHAEAADAGLLQPLEGKTPKEKERILRGLHNLGVPLPKGRTRSEKALINKIKAAPTILPPSEKMRRAKVAGLITPLKGKTPKQKEKILKGLANLGIPLPEGTTDSEKDLINKVRADVGLPPEPKTPTMVEKHAKAANDGLLQPLEGKTPEEKKRILRGLNAIGIPLPEGRTPSEKDLITKIKAEPSAPLLRPSEKMRKAKGAGLITPLKGKTPEQKERILKGLADLGIPLPEASTVSEEKLIDEIREQLGLPPEPKTPDMKEKHAKAADAGLLQPLEGKTPKEKEKILRGLNDIGIPLPEGRTPSEKALINKLNTEPSILGPSERMRRAKASGLITPLKNKTPAQREKILKGLASLGIPLPEGTTDSENNLINKVRTTLGLPPEPKTPSMIDKHAKAANAGLLLPLEGKPLKEKERILRGLNDLGIPLPEGRTPSEKGLINKIKAESPVPSLISPSEKIRRAKVAGLITPLKDKTPVQREKILKGLASLGIPLPQGTTDSEKNLINKVRANLGLPPEPNTPAMIDKHSKAADAGLLLPVAGKAPKEKERILRGLNDLSIPLPEGRTPSEKDLISKIKAESRGPLILAPSEKMRRAKAAGLLTPLEGKSPEKKERILKGLAMHGIPLPQGGTDSEKNLINKIRSDLGLPPEPKNPGMRDKHAKAADVGLLLPLEGKSPKAKEGILRGLNNMGIPLPKGRTPSEKALITKIKAEPRIPSMLAPSEKMRRVKAAGLLTPMVGKSPEKKEQILKGLATHGIPLPEGTTRSEKNLINKVRADLGLPPEPKNKSMRDRHKKAADAGLLQPLEGKTPEQKERILRGLDDIGIPLPEGRTPSEKALINKINAETSAPPVLSPSEKMRRAKVAGLITPLKGKPPEQREKILKGLANLGIPLPEGKTPSEKSLVNKIRTNLGLPPEPKNSAMKDKHAKAADAGFLQPLEGKTNKEKERILQGLKDIGIPLPEGRTPSEKSLVSRIKAESGKMRKATAATHLIPSATKKKEEHVDKPAAVCMCKHEPSVLALSDRMRKAKDAGLLTPLAGKPLDQKENILKGLAMLGLPLPEATTGSENDVINKVRDDIGLPPEPKTAAVRDKHLKAANAGLLQPLEGKNPKEKENILRGLADIGIPLPKGRTHSEKSLIAKIKKEANVPSTLTPSERMRGAKAAGLLTPLKGKTPEQKENILKGLAMHGIPLPESTTPTEKELINKIRTELGLPPTPKNQAMKDKHTKAADAGLLQPLEGKTPKDKEVILRGLKDIGIPLPEGRTPSEKALIKKIKAESLIPPDKLLKAKEAGLITPLEGKAPEDKEKILKGLAMLGISLPEGTTDSEKNLVNKVRADLGLPPEPIDQAMRDKHSKAADAGLLQPLEGKSPKEKEKILKGLADMGIPLPDGRTSSEKSLINKYKVEKRPPSVTTEKLQKAKEAGILTPLEGKSRKDKEKILKNLAKIGLPLPEGRSPSEKDLIRKIKKDVGITEEAPEEKVRRAKAAGLFTPLDGKTPEKKEKILRGRAAAGLPLPIGKTPSERDLIDRIKASTGYVTPSPSERQKRAKAAGLITPLAGKTPSRKIKIVKDMIAAGVPIPEGETPSEKSLIKRITSPKKTQSEKIKAAKAGGFLTPLAGKSPKEKEKIIKGLIKVGLPLPEAQNPSEKSLIDKLRVKAGLPPEPKTPSMKEKYRKAHDAGLITPLEGKLPADKKSILKNLFHFGIPLPAGRTPSEKSIIKKIKAEDEFIEEVTKTTVCDHACGCDKKKIKFKHSLVKITIVTPDISNLCPCPVECMTDIMSKTKDSGPGSAARKGIKVTVGSVVGIPITYSPVYRHTQPIAVKQISDTIPLSNRKSLSIDTLQFLVHQIHNKSKSSRRIISFSSFETSPSSDISNDILNASLISNGSWRTDRLRRYPHGDGHKGYLDYSSYLKAMSDIERIPVTYFSKTNLSTATSADSSASIFIVKSDTSLSLSTSTGSLFTDSFTSYTYDTTPSTTQCSERASSARYTSDTAVEYSSSVTNDYSTGGATSSYSNPFIHKLASIERIGDEYNKYKKMTQANIICLGKSLTKLNRTQRRQGRSRKACSSAVVIDEARREDAAGALDEVLPRRLLRAGAPLVVLVRAPHAPLAPPRTPRLACAPPLV